MTAVQPFDFRGNNIRVIVVEDEPWFVVTDVCDYFGVTNRNRVMQAIDSEDKGGTQIDTPGGRQSISIISESGLYALLFALRPGKARGLADDEVESKLRKVGDFKRWVTREVLPSIRRTGSYGAPSGLSFEEMTAQVISELSRRIEEAHRRAAELEAPAGAWNDLSRAEGDFTVSDAAKTLARAGVETGPRKLYDWLEGNKWVFRRGGRWQAMQAAVNAGLIVERLTSGYFDQSSGERKQGDPQIRLTPKGVERLRELMLPSVALTVVGE